MEGEGHSIFLLLGLSLIFINKFSLLTYDIYVCKQCDYVHTVFMYSVIYCSDRGIILIIIY